MSTETTQRMFGIEDNRIATLTNVLRHLGVLTAFGTFTIGYALLITITEQLFTDWGVWAKMGTPLLITIETTVGAPVVVSLVLAARYVTGIFKANYSADWTGLALSATAATWLILPALLVIWPQIGFFQ